MSEASVTAPQWNRGPEVGNLLLWMIGPGLFAVAGIAYANCAESTFVWTLVAGAIVGQPTFALSWIFLAALERPFWGDTTFRLLALHLLCLASACLLMFVPEAHREVCGALAVGLLLGDQVLALVLGVLCIWRLLHPTPVAARTNTS